MDRGCPPTQGDPDSIVAVSSAWVKHTGMGHMSQAEQRRHMAAFAGGGGAALVPEVTKRGKHTTPMVLPLMFASGRLSACQGNYRMTCTPAFRLLEGAQECVGYRCGHAPMVIEQDGRSYWGIVFEMWPAPLHLEVQHSMRMSVFEVTLLMPRTVVEAGTGTILQQNIASQALYGPHSLFDYATGFEGPGFSGSSASISKELQELVTNPTKAPLNFLAMLFHTRPSDLEVIALTTRKRPLRRRLAVTHPTLRAWARLAPGKELHHDVDVFQSFDPVDDVEMLEEIGLGMFGRVYRARWQGSIVAVKSMVFPFAMSGVEKHYRMALLEAATSSALSHPNIIQTYTYNMVPVQLAVPGRTSNSRLSGTSGSGSPGWEEDTSCEYGYEVQLVMEYCDGQTLDCAFRQGALTGLPPPAAYATNLELLCGVARGAMHLHMLNLVHGDLKTRNVLLRASPSEPCGFISKLADFGMSMMMDTHEQTHKSCRPQGTPSHMAPELIVDGRQSKAADVYAFGIMMWEVYTRENAYQDVTSAMLPYRVAHEALRPVFPPHAPPGYIKIASQCWAALPNDRPTFQVILRALEVEHAQALQGGSNREGGAAAYHLSKVSFDGAHGPLVRSMADSGCDWPGSTRHPSHTGSGGAAGSGCSSAATTSGSVREQPRRSEADSGGGGAAGAGCSSAATTSGSVREEPRLSVADCGIGGAAGAGCSSAATTSGSVREEPRLSVADCGVGGAAGAGCSSAATTSGSVREEPRRSAADCDSDGMAGAGCSSAATTSGSAREEARRSVADCGSGGAAGAGCLSAATTSGSVREEPWP
ncbi:hypothetical protein FOA52_013834 [Chlamydomonas sp. UWO 241]|nr:hypothetical protein FOA52_013834 [Chlamydomonas sp. UWO 241]